MSQFVPDPPYVPIGRTCVYPLNLRTWDWEFIVENKKRLSVDLFEDLPIYQIDGHTILVAEELLTEPPSGLRDGYGIFPLEGSYRISIQHNRLLEVSKGRVELIESEGVNQS